MNKPPFEETSKMNPAIIAHGPSRILVWSIDGVEHSQRYESVSLIIAAMTWKTIMLGADWAECRDEQGRMNHRSERNSNGERSPNH